MKYLLHSGILLTLFCIEATASVTLSFKQAFQHLEPPIAVSQVIEIDDKSFDLSNLNWPDELAGSVKREQVSQWLTKELEIMEELHWRGRHSTYLEVCFRPAESPLQNDLLAMMKSELYREGVDVSDISFKRQHIPCARQAINSWTWELHSNDLQPRLNAKLTLIQNGDQQLSATVPVSISATVDGLSLVADVKKGDFIASGLVRNKTLPWTGKEISVIHFSSAERQWVANKSMSTGLVLRRNAIRLAKDIESGQTVDVFLLNGMVKLETKGRSLSAGNVGEIIPVQVENAERVAHGIVASKGVVNVSV